MAAIMKGPGVFLSPFAGDAARFDTGALAWRFVRWTPNLGADDAAGCPFGSELHPGEGVFDRAFDDADAAAVEARNRPMLGIG